MIAQTYPIVISDLPVGRNIADYQLLTDDDLIQASQKHELRAIDALLMRFSRFIYAELFKLYPKLIDSSDLVQEVNVRVWRYLGTLKQRRAFKSWLNRIIHSVLVDNLRKQTYTLSLDEPIVKGEDEKPQREIPDHSSMPDRIAEGRETSAIIEKAFEKLPAHFRKTLMLREIEGLSYMEIARVTNTEIGTVKSRVCRARQRMQTQLAPIYAPTLAKPLPELEMALPEPANELPIYDHRFGNQSAVSN
jgi:RNA polymerase sigma-70 factor (ECF subfamily)